MKQFLEQEGLIQISDMRVIEGIVEDVLSQNQQQLQEYCAGKTKLQGFFVGQVSTHPSIWLTITVSLLKQCIGRAVSSYHALSDRF